LRCPRRIKRRVPHYLEIREEIYRLGREPEKMEKLEKL
jgi:hypothetical protein